MATSKGHRIGAFILALLFLGTTIFTAGYVIWQLRSEGGLVEDVSVNEIKNQEEPVQQPTTIDNFEGPIEIAELRYDDIVVGTGAQVQPGDTVTIHYTGALASDGSVFDSSLSGEPATFPLGNLIQGWQQGIPGMSVGGKRRLYIPAELGYGASGSGSSIPPDSDLIFDIELFNTAATQ